MCIIILYGQTLTKKMFWYFERWDYSFNSFLSSLLPTTSTTTTTLCWGSSHTLLSFLYVVWIIGQINKKANKLDLFLSWNGKCWLLFLRIMISKPSRDRHQLGPMKERKRLIPGKSSHKTALLFFKRTFLFFSLLASLAVIIMFFREL